MTLDTINQYYVKAVEFVVRRCMGAKSVEATSGRLLDDLAAGEDIAAHAQGEMRAALHDYFRSLPKPVRIDLTSTVVLLDRSADWVKDNKERLGYDKSLPSDKRYGYEEVCEAARHAPAKPGMRCVFLVNGQQVVGTLYRVNAFQSHLDALKGGARLEEMTVLEALAREWRDQDEKEIWGRAYIRVVEDLLIRRDERR